MSYEPDEIQVRRRLADFTHMENRLRGTGKELNKERKKELNSFLARKSVDPFCTIQVRESTIERLRQANINTRGIGNGQSYDDLLNNLIEAAENERKERNRILSELIKKTNEQE